MQFLLFICCFCFLYHEVDAFQAASGVRRSCVFSSESSYLLFAGFGKKKDVDVIVEGNLLCPCGSGGEYNDCCKIVHDAGGSGFSRHLLLCMYHVVLYDNIYMLGLLK
jgi:hypothetical protein